MPEQNFEDVPISEMDDHIREIAREEIASLCGLVLRRSQETDLTRSIERNVAHDVVDDTLAEIFGEALADFSGRTKGDAPGSGPGSGASEQV